MALTSLTYAYKINTRPGLSTSLRKRFICKHYWQTATYILAWTPYLGSSYVVLYYSIFEGRSRGTETLLTMDDEHLETLQNWFSWFNFFSVSVGIVISLVTIFEPSFLNVVSSAYCRLVGRPYVEGRESPSETGVQRLLIGSLITEVVKTILTKKNS